jgi:ATP phosphoribosyltransferase
MKLATAAPAVRTNWRRVKPAEGVFIGLKFDAGCIVKAPSCGKKRWRSSIDNGSKAGNLMNKKQILRFGLPKGSLQDATLEKMAKAGFNISVSSRSYIPYVDDPELDIRLIRAQEISRYVEHGYLDCGITGYDWIQENGSKVHEVGEFQFNKATRQTARWVLAVPEDSPIRSIKDLKGKRIATELVHITGEQLK